MSRRSQACTTRGNLGSRAVVALGVAAGGAGGADDNHATALTAVLESRHFGEGLRGFEELLDGCRSRVEYGFVCSW